ncbi:MAG: bifunctional riboflavin kinase/FAD synthetase [Lachnospiraceae bacterium]|nr:bifunctional riboflavin kinase/FAD synthetase [Lachnospiraceae bacterium]
MQIIAGTTDFKILQPTAVAIGKFDGLHRGHRELLKLVLEKKKAGLLTTIFTFDPPPEVFFGKRQPKEITTRAEKRIVFEKMGVDILIEFPLDEISAALPAEDFVKNVLKDKMNISYLAAGYDLSFGHKGAGNAELLKRMAPKLNFELSIIEKVCENGREISSTYVREEVEIGAMNHVTELLGEPYMIIGEVVHGAKLGRKIGMPTINLLPEKEKMLPPNGVYYSRTQIGEKEYKSITNIGKKPTVSNIEQIGVETYLYEFDQDVYGKNAIVKLLEFKRPERKFADLDELKAQMIRDVNEGREF